MSVIQFSPDIRLEDSTLHISRKASDLIKKFHQSADGLTLKNWKTLAEILDYAASAEQTIAEQKQYISSLESLTTTDMLTGLLNRHGMEYEIMHAIARANRYDENSLFAFIDLDNFKLTNDTYGHNAGDALLKRVAEVIETSVRQTDYTARLSGDEFAILLTNCNSKNGKEKASYIRHKLRKIKLNYAGEILYTGASMGFAEIKPNSLINDIFETADQAMYKNKRARKRTQNKYHFT